MYPFIHIKFWFIDRDFSSYGVCVLFAFLFFIIPALIDNKRKKEDFYNRFIYLIFLLIVGSIFAAILYQITNIPYWTKVIPIILENPKDFMMYLNFGIVYYGGFIGILIGMMFYSKIYDEDVRAWTPITALSIPGFHAIGRIGCAIGGCCYGPEVAHGGIYNARIDKYCMPIQLYEAAAEFVIFLIILTYILVIKDYNNYYRALGIYCSIYGILRFITEFWRADKIRGIWGPFSTSQYISMIVFPFGIYCLICPTSKNFLNKMYSGRIIKKDK